MRTLILAFSLLLSGLASANPQALETIQQSRQELDNIRYSARSKALDNIKSAALNGESVVVKRAALESLREAVGSIDTDTSLQAQEAIIAIVKDADSEDLVIEAMRLLRTAPETGWASDETKISAARSIIRLSREFPGGNVPYTAAIILSAYTESENEELAQMAANFEHSYLMQ